MRWKVHVMQVVDSMHYVSEYFLGYAEAKIGLSSRGSLSVQDTIYQLKPLAVRFLSIR